MQPFLASFFIRLAELEKMKKITGGYRFFLQHYIQKRCSQWPLSRLKRAKLRFQTENSSKNSAVERHRQRKTAHGKCSQGGFCFDFCNAMDSERMETIAAQREKPLDWAGCHMRKWIVLKTNDRIPAKSAVKDAL